MVFIYSRRVSCTGSDGARSVSVETSVSFNSGAVYLLLCSSPRVKPAVVPLLSPAAAHFKHTGCTSTGSAVKPKHDQIAVEEMCYSYFFLAMI